MKIIPEENFKCTHNGKQVSLYTLRNKNGFVAQITNYGAIIVSIFTPDRNGQFTDIVLGYDKITDYIQKNSPYMGAICGRCANRIAGGKFILDDIEYSLPVNNGPNHLHGGITGFNKVVWDVIDFSRSALKLKYLSRDGEEGYPGNLNVIVTYSLTDENELKIDFLATTDKTTIVNLAGHSYFNLSGEGSGLIYDHELLINGLFYTPTDETNIPTGEILSVKGTPFDFTSPAKIGERINSDNQQLKYGAGYDHNWVLNHPCGKLGLAAVVYDPASGRVLEVYTTQPGLQLYTANYLKNENGKEGKKYNYREAFCLETQHFPDSINKPHFPTVILNQYNEYKHSCVYKFSTK